MATSSPPSTGARSAAAPPRCIRIFGDIDLAEEAVAEAFVIAAERWPVTGIPPNPGGWVTTTARNRAIDRLRREATRTDRYVAAHRLYPTTRPA